MGVYVYIGLFYGVAEPKKWVKTKRKTEETYSIKVCPNGHGSKKGLGSKFCPHCGSETENVSKTRVIDVAPAEVYGEPGWEDTCEGEPWDWLSNHPLVHDKGAVCDRSTPLFFGVRLGEISGRGDDPDQRIKGATVEQAQELDAFLDRIGYKVGLDGPPPQHHLISLYS